MAKRELIGEGGFTKCFKKDENTVILLSVDPIKKHFSEINLDSEYFVHPIFLDVIENYHVYEMPMLKTLDWNSKNYELLNKRSEKLFNKLLNRCWTGYREILHFLKNDFPKGYEPERKALLKALRSFWGTGMNISMEFCRQNTAVNPDTGNLIFMDMFFPDYQKDLYELGLDEDDDSVLD